MWEKKRKHNNDYGEVIQVGLKDTTYGIRANVFTCAMEHSIHVFFLVPPLSRHYITLSNI